MQLHLNNDAVVGMANKLEKMHRSALPLAIRGSLNKAAFNTKTKTLLDSAKDTFVTRQPNFFKAFSRVQKADGWDVEGMQAIVGFTEKGLKGDHNYSVADLEQQEEGGSIKKRSFIPVQTARKSKSSARPVRPMNRLSRVKNVVNAKKVPGVNSKQKFVKAVHIAGKGGYVLSKFNDKQILWRVNSIRKTATKQFKLTALYSYKEGRKVNVEATNFSKNAALKSGKDMAAYFYDEAKRQIVRLENK